METIKLDPYLPGKGPILAIDLCRGTMIATERCLNGIPTTIPQGCTFAAWTVNPAILRSVTT